MTDDLPAPRLPSDHRSLWERATELDREARPPEVSGRAVSPTPVSEPALRELLDVGREVGISPDSVLHSVAESRLPDGGELRPRSRSPLWHQVLVETVDALEAGVQLALPPRAVVALLDEVMALPEYRMELEDRIGDDPEEGSVSVYRKDAEAEDAEDSGFHDGVGWADGRVLIVTAVKEPEGGSRIRIRMPLYERGTNLVLSAGAGGLAGSGGASAGAALGEAVVAAVLAGSPGLLPLAVLVAPAVVGTYVGVGAGILGFRRLQRWGFGKGQAALNRLARALEMRARDQTREKERPQEGDRIR